MIDAVEIARTALSRLGIRGVSALTLVVLVSLGLYAHKAAKYGGKVAYAGGRAAHEAKVIAGVLVVLLVAGVISADVERARTLVETAGRQIGPLLGRWLW